MVTVVFPRLIVPRRAVTVAGLVVAVGCAAAAAASGAVPWVLGSFLGALVVVASLLVGPAGVSRSGTLAWWYPIAGLPLLVVTVSLATVAGWARLPLWGGSWSSFATWTLVVAGFAALAWRRGGRIRLTSGLDAVAWAPALALAGIGAWLLTQPSHVLMRIPFLATDYTEHARLLTVLVGDHNLAYGPEGTYPRGVHATIAWLVSIPGLPDSDIERWITTLAAVVMGAWLATVLTLAVMALTVTVTARRISASPRSTTATAVIGVIGGALTIAATGYWLVTMTIDGFLTTAAAAWLLAVVVLLASRHSHTRWRELLIVTVVACLLMAHIWPLILPPLILIAVAALIAWWRSGHPRMVATLIVLVGLTAFAAPPLWALLTAVGISATNIPGGFTAYPIPVVVAIIITFPAVAITSAIRVGNRWWWATWTTLVVGLALEGGLLFGYVSATPSSSLGADGQPIPYYPAKVLWHAVTLAAPSVAAAAAVIVVALWRASGTVRIPGLHLIRPITLTVILALGGAYALGSMSAQLDRTWNAQTVATVFKAYPLLPITYLDGQPHQAVMVRGLNPGGLPALYGDTDRGAIRLLGKDGWNVPPEGPVGSMLTGELCDWLKNHPDAIRITGPNPNYGPAELLRNGCPTSIVKPDEWIRLVAPNDWGAPDWSTFQDVVPTPLTETRLDVTSAG